MADARHLPQAGLERGDRHLKFYETRDNLRIATLDGLGHWWMLQDPVRGAAALTEFWATLD